MQASSYVILAAVLGVALGVAINHPDHPEDPEHMLMQQEVVPKQKTDVRTPPREARHACDRGRRNEAVYASCTLIPSSPGGPVSGLITLYQLNRRAPVIVKASVEGLTPGKHGFHLHRDGNTEDMCKSAGPHFNPDNYSHGGPRDATRHAGDFGNIEADSYGVANVNFATRGISLQSGATDSALGRAFVVHANVDDLGLGGNAESLNTGNAGPRVACCVVTA